MKGDKGLYEIRHELEAPLTKEDLLMAEKFHRHISNITEQELNRPFTM